MPNNIGSFGENFPYSNFHNMNMDWITKIAKDFLDQYTNIQQLINDTTTEGIVTLTAKKDELEGLLNQWYETHSNDIASQLATALQDITNYTNQVIASLPPEYTELSNRLQDTIDNINFNLYTTESGTFTDASGTIKVDNTTRRRNRSVLPITDIAYIEIPDGYEMYTFCLNQNKTKFNIVDWTNTELNTKDLPFGTYYINYALRKTDDPSADISNENVDIKIIRKGYKVVPRWNVNEKGIYIDGHNIVVDANGFQILHNNQVYTIAPTDMTSETTFTATINNSVALVIDTSKLTTSGRNNPQDVFLMLPDIPYSVSNDKYICVACYYKTYWEFMNEFTYMYQISKQTLEPDHVTWNNKAGGITIINNSIIVNEDGFSVAINGHTYYIAPRDETTISTFTAPTSSTKLLVLDPCKLKYIGARNDPEEVLSVIDFRGTTYTKTYIVIAVFYKGIWNFSGKFAYFQNNKYLPVNNWFNTTRLIGHQKGNTVTALNQAISDGYKIIEADAQMTNDNIIVMHHDPSFTVSGTSYTIAQLSYEQLHTLMPSIPKLTEILNICKRHDIAIDLDCTKRSNIEYINAVYITVKQCGCLSRVAFTTFSNPAKQLLNNGSCIICLSEFDTETELKSVYDIINKSALCICSLTAATYTPALLEMIHSYGALTKIWTVNTIATIQTMFNNNADFIITDSIKESQI